MRKGEYLVANGDNVNTKCDAFIIPNHSVRFDQMFEFDKGTAKKVCDMNNVSISDDTTFINLWMCAEGLSDNFCDHGINIDVDNVMHLCRPRFSWFPAELFSDSKEGDIVSMNIPCYASPCDASAKGCGMDINLTVHMKLSQKDYRYRRFGSFEDTMKSVM